MTHAGVPLSWLTIPGDRLAPWGLRPLDREAAVEFVELIVRLSEGSEVLALCDRWRQDLAAGNGRQALEWRQLSADSLVGIGGRLPAELAVAACTFLPGPFRQRLSLELRASLYALFVPVSVLLALLLMGAEIPANLSAGSSLLRWIRAALEPDAPENFFAPVGRLGLSGASPLALAEIARRGREHPAGYCGVGLLAAMDATAPEDADVGLASQAAAAALVTELRRHTAPGSGRILRALRRDTSGMTREQRAQELDEQTLLTLVERQGSRTVAAMLVEALEGRLDVLPLAVQSDLIDRFRHHQVIDRFEVSVEKSRAGDQPDERRPEETLRSTEPDPEVVLSHEAERREHERVRTAIEAQPLFQTMLRAIQDGAKTQKDIAARCGVSERMVRYWITRLRQVAGEETGP